VIFLKLIKQSFSLDLRSLSLYRIFLGLIVIADVIYRLPDLRAFYTDEGVLPRSVFLTDFSLPWSFSLHLANGSLGFIIFCFLIHLICGVFLTLGYRTQLVTFLSWIMTISVHNRNWLINNGGDDVLRSILLISIFLPLNHFFSLDSYLGKIKKDLKKTDHFSIWVQVFFFQVFSIYFMSYILKDHPIWREEYTALSYASALDIFATPVGVYLRNFPMLQKGLTVFTIFLEWLGPILLYFSFLFLKKWWVARSLVVLSFWALHLGIILCMYIGIFPYLCIVIWIAFIPSEWWSSFLSRFFEKMNFDFLQRHLAKFLPTPALDFKPCFADKIVKFMKVVFGFVVLLSLISWNLQTTKKINIKENSLHDFIRWLHIYQEWNMFAPHPKLDNIWVEVPALLEDGSEVELLTQNRDIYGLKAQEFVASIKNEHWRKFYLNLSEKQENLKYFASFLCRQWNEYQEGFIPEKKLKKMEVIIYSWPNFLDFTHGPVQKKFSWVHWCNRSDLPDM
jgi:hypothetical protein